MTITDRNGDYDVEKIIAAGGTIETVQVATGWLAGNPETLTLDLIQFEGKWYWTISDNGHCFGPHATRSDAITSATE